MSDKGSGLGILGYDSFEFVVTDIERSRRFYGRMMDVAQVARLSGRESERRGESALLYSAGKARWACVSPSARGSAADRWLKRHPDGVRTVGFRVRELEHARRVLGERGATMCSGLETAADDQGRPYRWFDIATPLGDVRFRFVERAGDALPPGFEPVADEAAGNRFSFQVIDHITSNLLTIEPHVTWLRDVMGFSEYWRVHFHTCDINPSTGGSGLASIVMWDPESGIKLANNEPVTPNYEQSQIYTFVEANHGPGVQHVAFHVPAIAPAVDGLRRGGIEFLDTPATYYDMLPERLAAQRVPSLSEDPAELKRLGVLVDGEDGRYLLQIFMVEGGLLYGDERAGPFFYEVIQRRGARGFGEGNFRALFEAIERDQQQRDSVRRQLDAGAGS
ncbi:MAG TPA: VOC family protein [Thermoanaerobaculales bacterium]|nr:VOC family protein [Thermoanaerobaculales bacterium]HPA80811.1 VOC family protein [Thermoanaerobaculales bacterium]HQL30534.1 VOC family protein [Thermoanaerobaculales bacterium]HQP44931.1 VOC family protein [Thermoanaerobaculales bacterium]